MRRTLALLIVIPVAVLLVLLAIANRAPVSLSLDPFSRDTPALSFTAPLFVFILLAMMAGVVIGGIATWLKQGAHRRLERQYRREAERYRGETEQLKSAMGSLPAPPR
jgi:uncharacterized integral membrane protein